MEGLALSTAPAAGGAVREQIFEQSLRAEKEDEKKVNEKMFFTKRLQMFCLPYCCCPCFAVLQDRALILRTLLWLLAMQIPTVSCCTCCSLLCCALSASANAS